MLALPTRQTKRVRLRLHEGCVRRGSGPAEQPRVVPIPVALKPAFGVVHQLRVEELPKSRIASLDLFPRRPRVIGEIEPPPVLDHPVDDPTKIGLGLLDAVRRVHDMQVADDADASPRGPRKKTLLVGLDEPDGSIGHVDSMPNEVPTHLGQKRDQ